WVKVSQAGLLPDGPTTYAVAWWADAQPDPTADGVISGVAWNDRNGDGRRQDGVESRAAGVRAYLYTSQGQYVATKLTDGNGDYAFTNLTAGDQYYVSFVPPIGKEFTIQRAPGVPTSVNSDPDANGYTGFVTADVAGDNDANHIDAGLRAGPAVRGH